MIDLTNVKLRGEGENLKLIRCAYATVPVNEFGENCCLEDQAADKKGQLLEKKIIISKIIKNGTKTTINQDENGIAIPGQESVYDLIQT